MFLGKVVAFLRNISFFSLFKSSFIDVDERRFLLLVSTKKLRYKSNSY
jgi:hypothetical protein